MNMENPDTVKGNRIILVVEGDDAVYSLLLGSLLEAQAGYSVVRMSDEELAGMLAADAPGGKPGLVSAHAIVLDEDWLGNRSTQVLSQLRMHKFLARVPVVMLMGGDDKRRLSEYHTLGASICILRPASREALKDTLTRLSAFLSVIQVPKH